MSLEFISIFATDNSDTRMIFSITFHIESLLDEIFATWNSTEAKLRSDILVVSFIGMETQEVKAANGVVVRLRENSEQLEDVIVVAFGTSTRKSFTGSASVVKSEDITKRQTSNITNSLAGQVAGVQGLSTSGQPGEVSNIRIRGIGSMNASNAPLYVIDGIPAGSDAISTLSNSDIESVTVLKDATSNALYGARGANGVILIMGTIH